MIGEIKPKYRYLFHLQDIKIDNIFWIFHILLLIIYILRTCAAFPRVLAIILIFRKDFSQFILSQIVRFCVSLALYFGYFIRYLILQIFALLNFNFLQMHEHSQFSDNKL